MELIVKKKHKVIFTVSVVVNVMLISILGAVFLKLGGLSFITALAGTDEGSYEDNPYYQERTNLFEEIEIPKGQTIFIGDSITQRGLWDELLPESTINNRGINSDTTIGVLNRLDDIIESKPEEVFIMIGVNDLFENKTVEEILGNYQGILKRFKSESPNTIIYIQSVLPVNNEVYGDAIDNEDVKQLNSKLKDLAASSGNKFIDVYSQVSNDDQLEEGLTIDGIHLNGKGYDVWKEVLKDNGI